MPECPFCGAVNATVVQPIQAHPRPGGAAVSGHAAHCAIHKGGCGASGPIAMAPELAYEAWELRAADHDVSFYKRVPWTWRRPWAIGRTELVKARGRVRPL